MLACGPAAPVVLVQALGVDGVAVAADEVHGDHPLLFTPQAVKRRCLSTPGGCTATIPLSCPFHERPCHGDLAGKRKECATICTSGGMSKTE